MKSKCICRLYHLVKSYGIYLQGQCNRCVFEKLKHRAYSRCKSPALPALLSCVYYRKQHSINITPRKIRPVARYAITENEGKNCRLWVNPIPSDLYKAATAGHIWVPQFHENVGSNQNRDVQSAADMAFGPRGDRGRHCWLRWGYVGRSYRGSGSSIRVRAVMVWIIIVSILASIITWRLFIILESYKDEPQF